MKKDRMTALLLSIFLGGLGVDSFYLGYTGRGILKLLTGGLFGILWLIDIILIATKNLQPADGRGYNSGDFTSQSSLANTDITDRLSKLKRLHDEGILTDEEFTVLKKREMEDL